MIYRTLAPSGNEQLFVRADPVPFQDAAPGREFLDGFGRHRPQPSPTDYRYGDPSMYTFAIIDTEATHDVYLGPVPIPQAAYAFNPGEVADYDTTDEDTRLIYMLDTL